jgi:hypothetical protein
VLPAQDVAIRSPRHAAPRKLPAEVTLTASAECPLPSA